MKNLYRLASITLIVLSIFTFILWSWSDWFMKIREDFLLITGDIVTTIGTVVKEGDIIAIGSDESSDYMYTFDYAFSLPSGIVIRSSGYEINELPLGKYASAIPYRVEIEYLKNDPEINRVKGLYNSYNTLPDLFKNSFWGIFVMAICTLLAYLILRSEFKKSAIEI